MVHISNSSLAGLFALAIVISVGGTIINLERINTITDRQALPFQRQATAMATAEGNVTLNISSFAAIELQVANISFGTGYVNGSGYCNLSTVERSNVSNCSGFYGDNIPLPIQIENSGTQNVSISLNVSLNATTMFNTNWTNSIMALMVSCNKTNCCDALNSSYTTNWGLVRGTANTNVMMCGTPTDAQKVTGLNSVDSADVLDIDVAIWFNQNAQENTIGQLNSTFTIIGEGP